MKHLSLAAALLALLPAPNAAVADWPFSISGTETFLWRGFSDAFMRKHPLQGDSWDLRNRLVLNLERPGLLVGIQADFDRFDKTDGSEGVEKAYLEYRGSRWGGTAGDFYSSFGRGTALSVVKTHEAYGIENQIDNTIRGLRARYLDDVFKAEALGGTVKDDDTGTTDSLFGANLTYRAMPWLRIGSSVVAAGLEAPSDDARLAGGQLDLINIARHVDLSVEHTRLRSEGPFRNGADHGQATYVELVGRVSSVSIRCEYEMLRDFFFKYSTPPLLEDQAEELLTDFMALYPEDLKARKVRADWTLPTGTLVYGVYAHFNESATRHPSYFRYRRRITDVEAGGEHLFSNGIHVIGNIGKRDEESTGYYYQFSGPTTYGGISASVPVSGPHSIESTYQRMQLDGDRVQFQRNRLVVTYGIASLFSLAGSWESSNLPGELFSGHQKDFFAWQAELKLKSHVLRVFHGDSRGGMKCSGGVCTYVPAFGGTRVEAIVRF